MNPESPMWMKPMILVALLLLAAACDSGQKDAKPQAATTAPPTTAPVIDAGENPATAPPPTAHTTPPPEVDYTESGSPCTDKEKELGKQLLAVPAKPPEGRLAILREFTAACGEELPRYKDLLTFATDRGGVVMDGERLLSSEELEHADETHVTVREDYILVLNKAVVKFDENGALAEGDHTGTLIPKLVDALKAESERRKALGVEFDGNLKLIAMPAASDVLIDLVLASAKEAGFLNYGLASLSSTNEPPPPGDPPAKPCAALEGEAVRVTVRADGVCVHHQGKALAPLERCKSASTPFCIKEDGKHDWEAVYNALVTYLKTQPTNTLELSSQGVPYAYLVEAMVALRLARAPVTAPGNPQAAEVVESFQSARYLRLPNRKPIRLFETIVVVP